MATPLLRLPSRFRRLDEILADLPIDDPMLLSELDGYLTAIAVCPEPIAPAEWLPPIWGGAFGEQAPFEDPIDVRLFADMVAARHRAIIRDLDRGRHQPIFDVDPRHRELLWEEWIGGFAMALDLRPQSWSAIAEGDDTEAATAYADLMTLVGIATDDTTLTSVEINALCDEAAMRIPADVARLHRWRARHAEPVLEATTRPVKPGRNDPCACGSGKKQKRCCGVD